MADIGSTSGAATPGVTKLTTSTITGGTIENAAFTYFLQAGIFGSSSNVGLYGFNLTYSPVYTRRNGRLP